MLDVIIIQPPLVQLNTPYPSGAYLKSFFVDLYKKRNIQGTIKWLDLSTELFHKIFCRKGLSYIFEQSIPTALKKADSYEKNGDDNSAFQLRRYVSQSQNWCNWIDAIISIVCPNKNYSGRELSHEFVRSAHAPRGARMEHYLSSLNRDVSIDDSQILASLALADLADFITTSYDSNFSLIRYAEHLATSISSFDKTLQGLNEPILNDFYKPLLQEHLGNLQNQTLFLISIPFPGCFEAALYSGEFIKKTFDTKATVAFGGGYINTELRNITEKRLFNFCDFLSYDKGYGSYLNLFDECFSSSLLDFDLKHLLDGRSFYKIKYLKKDDYEPQIISPIESSAVYEPLEKSIIQNLIPDFLDIDFSKSPRLADDTNPMHRIWNDGAWIKSYMAYGCYWHKCAFCDTSLDYVNNYCNTNINNYFKGIYSQAEQCGIYGIHFVDEACPPYSLKEIAIENAKIGTIKQKLSFWGNVRFEKNFTRDLADILSYGGLTAISAGIEIATGSGLNSVNKGIDMENIVSACCAFKEAGILVHSYMIFGYWNQTEQDLINSMETLRQLFKAGLLDSAFWHKFSLTIHSTVYKEWLQGKHPDLKPIKRNDKQFAENEIHWEGEQKSEKYSLPLNTALEFWMHGEKLNKPVTSYFQFKMPQPSIKENYVESLIKKYEQKRDSCFTETPAPLKKYVWFGGKPFLLKSKNDFQLCWSYMGNLLYADVNKSSGEKIINILNTIKIENYSKENSSLFCAQNILPYMDLKLFKELRGNGLAAL